MKKKEELTVVLIKDVNEYLKTGSKIVVEQEFEKHYRGAFCSDHGTFVVNVPKDKCQIQSSFLPMSL